MGVNEALNEQHRNELKAFYSVIKTCDEYIRFAFLTGVTKFSKISIFSDLNNLRNISLEKHYAGICGITQKELETNFQPEIQVLADSQDLTYQETLTTLQQWYDGYCFAPAGKGMYNPFSLLNAFAKERFGSYWFETGTSTFLVNYLKEAHYFIPDLDGNIELDEEGLQTYRAAAQEPFPILFQSGYLTIKEYIKEARLYRLGFPNDEVRYGFLKNLLPAYSSVRPDETGQSVWRFVEDIRHGKVDSFMERMQSLIAGISYDNSFIRFIRADLIPRRRASRYVNSARLSAMPYVQHSLPQYEKLRAPPLQYNKSVISTTHRTFPNSAFLTMNYPSTSISALVSPVAFAIFSTDKPNWRRFFAVSSFAWRKP